MTIASGSAFATIHSTSAVLSRAPRRPRAGQPRIPFLCPAVGQPRRQAKCGRRRHAAPAAHFDRAFVQRCVAYRSLSCANQGRGALPRLVPSKEQLFPRSAAEQNRPNSASWSVRCGRPNRACISPRPSAAASATPTFSSPASASRMRALCWRSRLPSSSELIARSTNYGPASGPEKYSAPTGLQASGTCGPERAEIGALISVHPLPSSAPVGDHLKGDASPTVGMKGLASSTTRQKRDNRDVRSVQGPASEIPAAGYAALGRGPRNPRSLITGSGAGLAISEDYCPRCGVIESSCVCDYVKFSSGDGLGIHQPGSMTRGTRAKVKTPSGRARVRAKCPAVARSFAGRAA